MRKESPDFSSDYHCDRVYIPEKYMPNSGFSSGVLGDNFLCMKIKHLRKDSEAVILKIQEGFLQKAKEITARMEKSKENQQIHKKKLRIIEEFQEKTAKAIESCENKVNSYWQTKISELVQSLKQKTLLKSNEIPLESHEFYEKSMKTALIQYKISTQYELNEYYRALFIAQTSEITSQRKASHQSSMNSLIKQLELQQYEDLQEKKASWLKKNYSKTRIPDTPDTTLQEIRIKQQVQGEIAETIAEVRIEIEKALEEKFKMIDKDNYNAFVNSLEDFHSGWTGEVHEEPDFQEKSQEISNKKSEIIEKIKAELTQNISAKVSLTKNTFFDLLNQDFQVKHEEYRKKSEEKGRKQLEDIEKFFNENFQKKILFLIEKRLKPIEVKIKMNYFRRLENSKDEIRIEIEKRFLAQYKVFFI